MTTKTNGPEPIGPTEHLETADYWKGLYFDAIEESKELLAGRDELRMLRTQRQRVHELIVGARVAITGEPSDMDMACDILDQAVALLDGADGG